MSSGNLVIEMPYEGTLARDLVMTTANLLLLVGSGFGVNVYTTGNKLIITGRIQAALNTLVNLLDKLMYLRSTRMRVRWPTLVRNDKNALTNSHYVSSKLNAIETYGDLAKEYVNLLPKLASVGTIKFSGGNIAMPQLFKLEFYETTLSYNNPYKHKKTVKTNDEMLAIISSGLAAAYAGYIEVLTPKVVGDLCAARAYENLVFIKTMLGPVRSDPTIPYVFHNHVIAQKMATSSKSCLDAVAFVIHRISYTGNVFTETSREELRFSRELLNFVGELASKRCVDELEKVIRIASGADNVEALKTLTLLYEAIHGAFNPLQASYYLARFLADLKASTGRTLMGQKCLEAALNALLRHTRSTR